MDTTTSSTAIGKAIDAIEAATPPTSPSPLVEAQTSEPPTKREQGAKKKRERSATRKVQCKTKSKGSNGEDEDLGENPFNNCSIIRSLINGCTLPKMGHQLITNMKAMHHQRVEAEKVQEDHQAEIDHLLKEKLAEIDRLLRKKSTEVGGLQEMVWNTKQALAKAKEELLLEIKRREKAEVEAAELKEQVSRQILEMKAQAIEKFKTS
ncbi:hypothetical protein COCNU_13G007710 [Cocos nucifera]|uniref:Uncharacterized protein n=1 Tax=Cocos nucifera TaxID=13894 RepID=A0A8K0ITK9_COCNU|nr:hypothetical protein COCNU_13G007710 [Cocos nucifera]